MQHKDKVSSSSKVTLETAHVSQASDKNTHYAHQSIDMRVVSSSEEGTIGVGTPGTQQLGRTRLLCMYLSNYERARMDLDNRLFQ